MTDEKTETPGPGELPSIDFSTLVLSLATSAMMHMGLVPDPVTGDQVMAAVELRLESAGLRAEAHDVDRVDSSDEQRHDTRDDPGPGEHLPGDAARPRTTSLAPTGAPILVVLVGERIPAHRGAPFGTLVGRSPPAPTGCPCRRGIRAASSRLPSRERGVTPWSSASTPSSHGERLGS